jgi:hypothetical protein
MNAALQGILDPTPSRSSKRPRASDDGHINLSTTDNSPSKRLKRTKTTANPTRDSTSIFATSPPSKRKIQTYSKIRSSLGVAAQDDISKEQFAKNFSLTMLGQLGAEVPLDEIYLGQTATTVNPMDTLHHKPPEPSPLDSSAFVSPTNVSDPFTQQMFTQPSQQVPPHHGMGVGFEDHVPNLMFPELSSTIANSSSSVGKQVANHVSKGSANGTPSDRLHVDTMKDTQNHQRHKEQKKDVTHAPSPLKQDAAVPEVPNLTTTVDQASTARSTTRKRTRPDAAYGETAEVYTDTSEASMAKKSLPHTSATYKDEDSIVGLPKENYMPRPSRSRSALLPEESMHASSSSSTGKLKRLKRSKTADGMSRETTDKLVDMGFSASQSEAALIKTNWVFDKALDLLVREKTASKSPELARMAKSADSVKIVQPHFPSEVDRTEKAEPISQNMVIVDTAHAGKVFSPVVLVEAKVNGALKHQSRLDTNPEEQLEVRTTAEGSTEEPRASEQSPSSNTKIKRTKSTRGRGRPKKSDVIIAEMDEEDVLQQDETSFATKPVIHQGGKVDVVSKEQDAQLESLRPDPLPVKQQSAIAESLPKAPTKAILTTQTRTQAAEIIELDDDSDDDPFPLKSAKLRRTKTAPASALKKEKKKRGRPKKEKAETVLQAAPTTEQAHEEAKQTGSKVQEEPVKKDDGEPVVQTPDQNAKVVEWLKKPVENVLPDLNQLEETVECKQTKKVKAANKKAELRRDTTPKPATEDEEDDIDTVHTQAQIREQSKASAKKDESARDGSPTPRLDDEGDDDDESIAPIKTGRKAKPLAKKVAPTRDTMSIADSEEGDGEEDEEPPSKNPAKPIAATKKAFALCEETPFMERDEEDDEPLSKKLKKTKTSNKKPTAPPADTPKSLADDQLEYSTNKNKTPEPKPLDNSSEKDKTSNKENMKEDKKKVSTHSPIKKAPVRFRVGLSKRTRIEPLLKIKGR